jgi:hypothetical protein
VTVSQGLGHLLDGIRTKLQVESFERADRRAEKVRMVRAQLLEEARWERLRQQWEEREQPADKPPEVRVRADESDCRHAAAPGTNLLGPRVRGPEGHTA